MNIEIIKCTGNCDTCENCKKEETAEIEETTETLPMEY